MNPNFCRLCTGCLLFVAAGLWRTGNAQQLSWVETAFGRAVLTTVDMDGAPVRSVPLLATSLPEGLTSDTRGNLYWTELRFAGARILRMGTDPGDVSVLVEGASALRGISLDPPEENIYWASSNLTQGARLYRAGVTGEHPETLAVLGWNSNPRGVATDSTYVYWAEFEQGAIMRLALGPGGIPQRVIGGLDGPSGIAVDRARGLLYWSEMNGGRIGIAHVDGTNDSVALSGLSRPNYLCLSPGGEQVAWGEMDPPRIRWAETGGWDVAPGSLPAVLPAGLSLSGHLLAARGGGEPVPASFVLAQNFPNPFNGETVITFSVGSAGHVSLVLYDLLGRRVTTLYDGPAEPGGQQRVRFDARSYGSGVYMYRLSGGDGVRTRKLLITR